jgi:hypothetical protein
MSDYFDELEIGLRDAIRRRAHLPWYTRLGQLSVRHRGLAALVAALVVATPTVAAVGAASGWWFGKGSSDIYYPASATSGLGKVLPKDGRLLPIRVADPAGGPPWGIRLVKTTRGETCIQVGRVVGGEIGALGIDGSWNDDHEFHEIKPNDQLADLCGATDGAGNGFVDEGAYNAPASVDVPIYNGRHIPAPASSLRMIFVGLLGPDARSVTYKTPGGRTRTERTSGGVGAYLVVFRETAANCLDFSSSLVFSTNSCADVGEGDSADLRGPSAITAVTYDSGKTCSDQPSASFVAAYKRLAKETRGLRGAAARKLWDRFMVERHLSGAEWIQAAVPQCEPVGWVAPKLPKLSAAQVASPIKFEVVEAKNYCQNGPSIAPSAIPSVVACNGKVPNGYAPFDPGGDGPQVLVTVSFTARQPVTNANSWYQWSVAGPAKTGSISGQVSSGSSTQSNVRRGERITFTDFVNADAHGVYSGTIGFIQNAGQNGQDQPQFLRGGGGGLTVGTFSFRLPLKHAGP